MKCPIRTTGLYLILDPSSSIHEMTFLPRRVRLGPSGRWIAEGSVLDSDGVLVADTHICSSMLLDTNTPQGLA